ncbi:MAG: phosphoadenosine phosphosulfate reductase family protein [gamma proteobacterium symbiont of Clathrolucina costata]
MSLFEPSVSVSNGCCAESPDLGSYDYIVVAFSGGKDSQAALLYLLEEGVNPSRIELWHHCVDGIANNSPLMDWPVTEDYCRKFAQAFGLSIHFSWKVGGFLGEMLRENDFTKPVFFETPEGTKEAKGTGGKKSTRRKFPQTSASLTTRWCSAYLKVDVASKAITNQERFSNARTLVVTGERAQESKARSNYKTFEPHRADRRNGRSKRHVDHYRPVHQWLEEDVWSIIERFSVNPHPAYRLGWGRLSCMSCIFGSKDQWASVRAVSPHRFEQIANYESQFDCTIHRKHSVQELASQGRPYASISRDLVEIALSEVFEESIILENWSLPAGAYGDSSGPV